MDRHTLAAISIAGSLLDVLGGLYLAYDLLGGKHGPLRTLTRSVTYALLFGIGYGVPLGLAFGIASGLSHGLTLGFEYARVSRSDATPGWLADFASSAIRGLGFAVGSSFLLGTRFGLVFGALSIVGQFVAYRFGIRPTLDLVAGKKPRLSKRQFLAVLNRTVGYTLAGYIAGVAAHRGTHNFAFAIQVGLAIGVVSAIVNTVNPYVEWGAENMPERRMGVLGICLILTGFALQSVQYWVALLDVPLK